MKEKDGYVAYPKKTSTSTIWLYISPIGGWRCKYKENCCQNFSSSFKDM